MGLEHVIHWWVANPTRGHHYGIIAWTDPDGRRKHRDLERVLDAAGAARLNRHDQHESYRAGETTIRFATEADAREGPPPRHGSAEPLVPRELTVRLPALIPQVVITTVWPTCLPNCRAADLARADLARLDLGGGAARCLPPSD